jgi:hypothetical protein
VVASAPDAFLKLVDLRRLGPRVAVAQREIRRRFGEWTSDPERESGARRAGDEAVVEVVDFGNGVWSLARPEYESAVIE